MLRMMDWLNGLFFLKFDVESKLDNMFFTILSRTLIAVFFFCIILSGNFNTFFIYILNIGNSDDLLGIPFSGTSFCKKPTAELREVFWYLLEEM